MAWHERSNGRFIEIRAALRERNFIEWIKTSLFLETVLAMESKVLAMESISILKDDFSSKTDPSISISIALDLLDWSNKTT